LCFRYMVYVGRWSEGMENAVERRVLLRAVGCVFCVVCKGPSIQQHESVYEAEDVVCGTKHGLDFLD
jgi:hypothetical protein